MAKVHYSLNIKHYLISARVPLIVAALIALPIILSGYDQGRAFFDQDHFHLPVIKSFIDNLDISDYKAATAPGYHIIFALIGKVSGFNITLFKLINFAITGILICYLSGQLTTHYNRIQSSLLLMPMVLSLYILPAGIWLVPDNLAWLIVAWVLFQTTKQPLKNKQLILLSIVLASAVFIRQTYLWLITVLWTNALYHYVFDSPSNQQTVKYYVNKNLLATTPALLMITMLAMTWQGLVPPSFQSIHQHISPSAPAFFLALFAIYGSFYLPILINTLKHNTNKSLIILGAIIGFISIIFVDSNYSIKEGRFSGLWNIIKLTPLIGNKSILMIILSTIGGGLFAALIQTLKPNQSAIITTATIAFIASLTVNQFVYERYFSGYIFILLLFICHQATQNHKQSQSTYLIYSGTIVFSLINILLLYRSLTTPM